MSVLLEVVDKIIINNISYGSLRSLGTTCFHCYRISYLVAHDHIINWQVKSCQLIFKLSYLSVFLKLVLESGAVVSGIRDSDVVPNIRKQFPQGRG